METTPNDAKTGDASSPTPDATAASSTEQTTTPDPAQGQSIADVAKQAFDAASTQEAEQGAVHNEDKTPEQGQEGVTEEAPKVEPEATDTTPEQPPFHEHPRWKQKEKEAADNLAKAAAAESRIKEYEPLVKSQQYHDEFCRQYSITPDEVASMMTILALQKTDPAKAREAITPLWNALSQFDGNALPQDLQTELNELRKEVEDGLITEVRARKIEDGIRERGKLRAQTRNGEHRDRVTQEQHLANNQRAMTSALVGWDNSTRASNPDFKPKSDATAPDGLWEVTAKGFSYLMTTSPPQSPQAAVKLVEQAFNEAKALFTKTLAGKPTPKGLSTSRSSATTRKAPQTVAEVVAATARAHGIAVPQG